MKNIYTITEYGSFVADREIPGYVNLPIKTFDQLREFILCNRAKNTDALDLMKLSAHKGIGEIITAQNYVGMIAMQDGTIIEILPKVYSHEPEDLNKTKRLLIDMLKALRSVPYKNLQTTSVDVAKMNIFDIFVCMFVGEVALVVKRGLKCDYRTEQQNGVVFKGKLLVSQQIRKNYAHKERSYIEYDDYNVNRPENRLLKTTLEYLLHKTHSTKNKSDLKMLLNRFDQVDISGNVDEDFQKCIPDRNMKDYEMALIWCRVFLQGKSFTAYSGSQVAVALLFPMETLFECYIAAKISKALSGTEYSVSVQDRTYHLFDEPRRFSIRPDIVIRDRKDGCSYILDTKWKVLSDNIYNYGIAQSDMYQMYAYHKKYNAENVRLIYPITTKLLPEKSIVYRANEGVRVDVEFVDLYDIQNSIDGLIFRIKT